jgi:hypothetical protein
LPIKWLADILRQHFAGRDFFCHNHAVSEPENEGLTVVAKLRIWLLRQRIFASNVLEAKLRGADLSIANLSGADVSKANLSGATLIGADLSGANLFRADLTDANHLSGADLRHARLWDKSLNAAHLNGANLRYAHLNGAKLRQANLSGADLTRTKLGATIFADLKLASVIGLETCEHGAPSSLDHLTIERSASLSSKKHRSAIGKSPRSTSLAPDSVHSAVALARTRMVLSTPGFA